MSARRRRWRSGGQCQRRSHGSQRGPVAEHRTRAPCASHPFCFCWAAVAVSGSDTGCRRGRPPNPKRPARLALASFAVAIAARRTAALPPRPCSIRRCCPRSCCCHPITMLACNCRGGRCGCRCACLALACPCPRAALFSFPRDDSPSPLSLRGHCAQGLSTRCGALALALVVGGDDVPSACARVAGPQRGTGGGPSKRLTAHGGVGRPIWAGRAEHSAAALRRCSVACRWISAIIARKSKRSKKLATASQRQQRVQRSN